MNNVNPNNPLWNRVFESFAACLAETEVELFGKSKTTGRDVRHSWEQICNSGYIFMGQTNVGPLYLCMCHLPTGTTYYLDLKQD